MLQRRVEPSAYAGRCSGVLARGCWLAAAAFLLWLAPMTGGCSGSVSVAARSHADAEAVSPTRECESALGLTAAQCQQVAALALPASLPPSAGNRFADDEDAAKLGFLTFYDANFSTLPDVRCATCHLPEFAFGDAKPVSEVVEGRPGSRNALSILNAAWAGEYFFWDGRVDSLWSQPLVAFEHPDEMAGSRLGIAHTLYKQPLYKSRYEALFGDMPDLADTARFPAQGKPGDPRFDDMAQEDRDAINLVAANLGKALEAYMRKVATGPSLLDDYLSGEVDALEPAARAGLAVFVTAGCIACHSGPALSDGAFHNVGLATSDRGRASGIAELQSNLFNSRGPYFDDVAGPVPIIPDEPLPDDEGAFRTPSLRNLPRTAPYWHDGRFASITDVLESPHGAQLEGEDRERLMVFLLSLNGAYPERPWSDWPAR